MDVLIDPNNDRWWMDSATLRDKLGRRFLSLRFHVRAGAFYGMLVPSILVRLASSVAMMLVGCWLLSLLATGMGNVAHASDQAEEINPADLEFFEKHVRPLLADKCMDCHSASKKSGGLSLGSRLEILTGGDSGSAFAPKKPEESLILRAVGYEDDSLQMPPSGKLSQQQIDILKKWITKGLPDPRVSASSGDASPLVGMSIDEGKEFWSFRPIAPVELPDLSNDFWSREPVDRFIVDKHRSRGLQSAEQTSRSLWLKRVSFDLIGLPPSYDQIDRFEQDDAPDAYERIVDELLNSPQYGVRWGRHWLDVVRYADSNGLDENLAYGTAWRYRDYVIDAWNGNKRFDRFLQEQIAGDLLVDATRESHTATGYLVLGAKVLAEPDREKLYADTIDEQIDSIGKVFLGLSLGCVRCHDHKFDPVLQSDYYALAAILQGTRTFGPTNTGAIKHWNEIPFASEDEKKSLKKVNEELAAKQSAFSKAKASAIEALRKQTREKVVEYLDASMELSPHATLADCIPVAQAKELHPRVLLTCRTYLARNGESKLFTHWTECWKKKDHDSMRGYYNKLFALGDGSSESAPVDGDFGEEFRKLAQSALKDATGFLAIPAKLEHALPESQIAELHRLAKEARLFESQAPGESTFMGVTDGTPMESMPIHIRGNHRQPGRMVKRGFPEVLVSFRESPIFNRHKSARLELAQWLTSSSQPLTARVIVNRIWRWHFGRGIVGSTENFGKLGDAPRHPELLDYLARAFIASGWSIKELHRSLLLSSTYRMSSSHPDTEKLSEQDPENVFLSRFSRLRLDAEQIRDSILHVTSNLDYRLGGKTVPLRNRQFVFDHTSIDHTKYDMARRTAYFPIIRNNLAPLLQLFDFPDPTMPTGNRATTSVAPQALLLMNAGWIIDGARSVGNRLAESEDPRPRIEGIYRTVLGRPPLPTEVALVQDFIQQACDRQSTAEARETAWGIVVQNLMMGNEFMFVR